MGYGFGIKCKKCDYSEDFFLGIGMMYYSLENVINQDNIKIKKIREEIVDLINNHKVVESIYSHEIYRCEKCDSLYRKFYVEVHYDEDKVYKTEYKCTKCRVGLIRLEELDESKESELEGIPCPKCHDKKLHKEMTMLWD